METAHALAPAPVVDADDLHPADADQVLADALEYGVGSAAEALRTLPRFCDLIAAAGLPTHVLRPAAADLLA